MNAIRLHTDMPRNITLIPNEFLDHYMSGANGEFLKIYLYLLRWAGCAHDEITTSSIADFFNMTENDVKRALRFWEQEKLLRIAWDDAGNITDLCLRPVTAPYAQEKPVAEPVPQPEAVKVQPASPKPVKTTPKKERSTSDIPFYSMDDLQTFVEKDGGEQLFFIIQQYSGKPLNQDDMNTVLFFRKGLGMSLDLIEHLFEYCISNGHRKMNYIQAVAMSWAEAGIQTPADAKVYCASYNKVNSAVMNAFGIKGRYLSDDELSYIRRWQQEYKLSQELIVEACRRTILTAHSASFKYADSILERWHSNQVETMDDVLRLDTAFEQAKAKQAKESKTAKTTTGKKPASRFHNFNQRTYDYSNTELEFIKKLHSGNLK
ncbi:MAG: DnaD domain protein [Lachnospiraceae bacterium]|nr:DnaD domain protein [Lachnospiraceae bacterium]